MEELSEDLEDALLECRVYQRMGGLDIDMIHDIAQDHGIDPQQLIILLYGE